jgi:hypothetical protein
MGVSRIEVTHKPILKIGIVSQSRLYVVVFRDLQAVFF